MQRLEVSCAVRRIYTSLGAKGLVYFRSCKSDRKYVLGIPTANTERCTVETVQFSDHPLEVRSPDLFLEDTRFSYRAGCSLYSQSVFMQF